MKDFITSIGIGLFALIILAVFLWPLAIIWAVNTLFGLAIAYTFWNWLAAMIIMAAFGKTHVKVNKG